MSSHIHIMSASSMTLPHPPLLSALYTVKVIGEGGPVDSWYDFIKCPHVVIIVILNYIYCDSSDAYAAVVAIYIYIYNPSSQQQRSSIMVSLYKLHNPDNRNSNDRGKASIHLYWFITLTLTSTIWITEIFWDFSLHYVGSCLQSNVFLCLQSKQN